MSNSTTAIHQAQVLAAKRMIERSMERFDLYPAKLIGDSAYGSADMLGWLVDEYGIEPHVTVFDKSARKDGTFSRDDFAYDQRRDIYSCPAGKTLAGHNGHSRERQCDDALPSQQKRLHGICSQAQVLSEHPGAESAALNPRGRS